MRLGFFLLVVATALLASCDASAARPVNDIPSGRFLRTEALPDGLKILPKTVVKELVADSNKLKSTLQLWGDSNVSVKRLAKSLKLNTNQIKKLRKFANRHKTDEVFILKQYAEHLANIKKTPTLA
ncbi:hypothetical protein V7S43_005475 [Phytophthora oleae]|uniref:RxLR effector protein n=1 Tax=Phytophthora oleae TaxID=2107226 RepID=A0ABD3FRZ1_9STRA